MHDLSLGGPVPVGRDPNAKHAGSCFDGVYGCHLCWNAANDGKGTESECDACHARVQLEAALSAFAEHTVTINGSYLSDL